MASCPVKGGVSSLSGELDKELLNVFLLVLVSLLKLSVFREQGFPLTLLARSFLGPAAMRRGLQGSELP